MTNSISLTAYEKKLVVDPQVLLAKNAIIRKVSDLFIQLIDSYGAIARQMLPEQLHSISPKISKGEQYLGLPYVVLDYPRVFSKEHTFAIRTFFWWGNFFSIHLQLSGKYQQEYATRLQTHIGDVGLNNWYIGVHESEWHHHFEADNYQPIGEHSSFGAWDTLPFLKLAKKIPLSEWDSVQGILKKDFEDILVLLSD